MEETTGQAPRRTRKRNQAAREWLMLEQYLFCFLALIAIVMTVSGLFGVADHFRADKSDTEEPPKMVTITKDPNAPEDGEEESGENGEAVTLEEPSSIPAVITDSELTKYAGDSGYGGQLYAMLDNHPEAAYILRNLDLYPEDLLIFCIRFPEAMGYAASWLDFDRMNITQPIDLAEEGRSSSMPYLCQWDSRWGYSHYGSGMVGHTGCGPTCLSMVSLYLTGWHNNDPASIAKFAEENGYYTKGSGSAWTLMSQACVNFGLLAKEIILDENRMVAAIEDGKPIICAMGPGYFTDNGHYIVLYGYEDGKFLIKDPNSPNNTAKKWAYSDIKGQIKNIWSFEPA